ncbi:MAG: hypothetical protein M0020_06925 [Actinomycetota bacterium]|nr:hypothetical protein [Actinomycetota bacterium]
MPRAVAPSDDGVLQFGHAPADAPAERGSHVVGFEVHELAANPAFEVGDLAFDLAGALLCRRDAFRLGRGFEAGAPVAASFGPKSAVARKGNSASLRRCSFRYTCGGWPAGMSFDRWCEGWHE